LMQSNKTWLFQQGFKLSNVTASLFMRILRRLESAAGLVGSGGSAGGANRPGHYTEKRKNIRTLKGHYH